MRPSILNLVSNFVCYWRIQCHCWLDRRRGLDGAVYMDLMRASVYCLRIPIASGWMNAGCLNLELTLTDSGSL